MSKLSQVNAVIEFTKQVLGERWDGKSDVKEIATKDDQVEISHLITAAMVEGTVDVSDDAKSKYGADLRTKYVMGMIRNHWNKSKKLNGGVEYEAKGTRVTDPTMRNLKALLAQHAGNPEVSARIQAEIDALTAAKQAAKAKPVTIDPDLIPESLRDLIAS